MNKKSLFVWLLGLGAVVVGVLVVFMLVGGNATTALDADQARAEAAVTTTSSAPASPEARVSTTSRAPEATTVPADGEIALYSYRTVGFEAIDALTGARHDYPAETFLTVRTGGCGQILRWQAIEERWTSWEVCDPQRLTVAGYESFHRWFGVDDLEHYRCDDLAPYLPPSPEATTWTFVCSTEERAEETSVDVIGTETLDVDGQKAEALHLRYTSTLSGGSTGGSVTDRWFRSDDRLLLKEVGSTASATSSPIGTVNYTEEYEIALEALDPVSQ